MPVEINKKWALVEGDRIVLKADTQLELMNKAREEGIDPEDYHCIALPRCHSLTFI